MNESLCSIALRVARIVMFSVCGNPMNVSKPELHRFLKSDMARARSDDIAKKEHVKLPDATDEMLAHALVDKGGRPVVVNPRKQLALRLPALVIER